ncbi:MAG: cytosine permease [Ancrocorticia sp.]|jgi:purine-cytosine permease-like protein|nr:cytosine permease [Ancrocorticia sp.]MCI2002068.1 cytosine permease [Ancrocorticia sp.]MCI2012001.1 cytosine permease [Ancrocorticia sp.]MCI2029479.1 cytosine permease [Ancrocorticia sp.]
MSTNSTSGYIAASETGGAELSDGLVHTRGRVLSKVEQRGIEPVPAEQQQGKPGELFWVWFAANISILGIPLGATLISLGLNLFQALIAAFIGSFGSFAVVGIVSIAGKRGGAPSLTLSRAIFGVRGNMGPTLIALMSRLGWETVNTVTGAFALLSLSAIFFRTNADAKASAVLTVVCVAIFVACTVAVAAAGHATILKVQKWATWIFGGLTLLVALYLAFTVDWSSFIGASAGPMSAVIIGIGTIASGTGIGWATSGADMARYQHKSVSGLSLVLTASAGAGIPLVFIIGLGSALTAGNSSIASADDPIAAVREALPAWVAVPYLIAAFGGLLLSNHLSVYSAGLTTLTLGIRIPRAYAVVLDVVVTTTGALYFMLVSDGFYGPFITFISLLAVPLTAWIGIFLVDMVRRASFDKESLMNLSSSSAYWYHAGIEWRSFGAWIVAMVVGFLFVTARVSDTVVWFSGPLSRTVIGENGLAWLVSLVIGAALYAALGGARLPESLTAKEMR